MVLETADKFTGSTNTICRESRDLMNWLQSSVTPTTETATILIEQY